MKKLLYLLLLVFLMYPASVFCSDEIGTSHPEGIYQKPITVRLYSSTGTGRIFYRFSPDETSPLVPYSVPLELTALPGERKVYNLTAYLLENGNVLAEKSISYSINLRRPVVPSLSPPSGEYQEEISLEFSGYSDYTDVMYSINGPVGKEGVVWNGEPIELKRKQQDSTYYTISAYSVDDTGNSSAIKTWTYSIRGKERRISRDLLVRSPVPGNFANTQYLLIDATGLEWIRYTTNGRDPLYTGIYYTTPSELPLTGTVHLRIAAKPANSETILRKEVNYSVTPVSNIKTALRSGIYSEQFQITLESDNDIFYTFGDNDPGQYGLLYSGPLELQPPENSLRTVILRFQSYSKLTSRLNEHRYVLLLDSRIPEAPEILIDEPTPDRSSYRISMYGSEDGIIRYTLDGTPPDSSSSEYREPIYRDGISPRLVVRAKSFLLNGRASRESRKALITDSTAPAVPDVSVSPDPEAAGAYRVSINSGKNSKIRYELSYTTAPPQEPTTLSPECPATFTVAVPYGMEQNFHFKFSLEDARGTLSPSRDMKLFLDRYPPSAPVISYRDGDIILQSEGDNDLFYSLFETGTTPVIPDSNAIPYSGPAPVSGIENELKLYTAYAVAVDKKGNYSDIAGPFNFEIDLRPPLVPSVKGITNGGSINLPQAVLRFSDKQQSTDIYYSLSTDGSEPPVPDMDSPIFGESLVIQAEENKNTEVRLIFLPVHRISNIHGKIERFTFTIDRTIPNPPGMEFNNGFLTMTGEGNIFFTLSDDLDPDSSENQPLLYQSPVPLPGMEGRKIVYTISALCVDSSGNLSSVSGPDEFIVDRRVPYLPSVTGAEHGESYNTDLVRLSLNNDDPEIRVYYTYTLDGKTPPIPDLTSPFIDKIITLKGIPGDEVLCSLKFLPYNISSGRTGDVSQLSFTIDLKPPTPPVLDNRISTGVSNEQYFPVVASNEDTETVYIGISEEKDVLPDPFGEDGLILTEKFSLDVPWGTAQTFYFSLGAMDKAGNRSSSTEIYSITIDKIMPRLPAVSGIEHGARYNHRKAVTLDGANDTDTLFYALAGADLDDLNLIQSRLQPYRRSIQLDVADGQERTFFLYTAARDRASNLVINSEALICTLDKKAPKSPRIYGIPESGVARDDVEVVLDGEGAAVYYEVSAGGQFPELPSADSRRYSTPIILEGVEGMETTFFISAVAMDKASNISGYPQIGSVTIDRNPPANTAPPYLDTSLLNENYIQVSWDNVRDDIYYRLDGENSFARYSKPFSVAVSENTEEIPISYFVQDEAGNQSETETVRLPITSASRYLIAGVQDSHVYNDKVTLRPTTSSGVIRYGLSADTGVTPAVNRFSPILKDSFTLTPLPGETVDYIFKAVFFNSQKDSKGIREETYRFTLDRHPPPVPEIVGLGKETYFKEDLELEIHTAEGTAYYQLLNTTAGSSEIKEEGFMPYNRPIQVEAEKGEFASYILAAYSVDDAGNKSRLVTAPFYIDREIIYVATNGNDNFSGSRDRPFKTIEKALDFAAATGRKTLFLNEGIHLIGKQIAVSRDVTIVGGFETATWRRDYNGTTSLIPGNDFAAGDSLFVLNSGRFILRKISLQDTDRALEAFFHLKGGELHLTDSRISLEQGYQQTAILQEKGLVSVIQSDLSVMGRGSRMPVISSSGTLEIENSRFSGTAGKDVILITGKNSASIRISGSELNPGSGGVTASLVCSNSNIEITDSILHSGAGSTQSHGIQMVSSRLSLSESEIKGHEKSRSAILVYGEESSITVEKSRFEGMASQGSILMQLKNSEINLSRSVLKGHPTGEYLYLFKTNGSNGRVSNNQVFGSTSGDFLYVESSRSGIGWFNNTFVFGKGKRQTRGFRLTDDKGSKIANNILIPDPGTDSVAFFIHPGSLVPLIQSNNCSSWNVLLQQGKIAVVSPIELNSYDSEPVGGSIEGNISEEKNKTFKVTKDGDLKLQQSSLCVDSGVDVTKFGGAAIDLDWEGEKRPNATSGITPRYDIGADEYYSLPQTLSGS